VLPCGQVWKGRMCNRRKEVKGDVGRYVGLVLKG
jgi:hypothetical protein